MKEFEKWWKKHNPEGCVESPGFKFDREVWKAALTWMLKQLDYSSEHKEIEDKIYEELE